MSDGRRGDRVSVIIPTYNRAHLVSRAIESARRAIRPGDEILVIDDGSTDDTPSVMVRYEGVVRYVRTPNGGAGAARNRGVAEARHPIVAFLDSDDEWYDDHLELARELLAARPDLAFCCSNFTLRDVDGSVVPGYLLSWHGDHRRWDEILAPGTPYSALAPLVTGREDFRVHIGDVYSILLDAIYVATTTVVARRSVALAGPQEEGIPLLEDWYGFTRMAKQGPAAYLDADTTWNHGHRGPRISTSLATDEVVTLRLRMLRDLWGSDAEFLATGRARFERVMREQLRIRARFRISRGAMHEARRDLASAGGGTMVDRALAALPAPVARGLGDARRLALSVRRRLARA